MTIVINNKTFQTLSTKTIIIIAIIIYFVSATSYYIMRHRPEAANFIVTETKWLGTFTRAQHIILFAMIGYLIPNRYILMISLGAGWEVIEYCARLFFKDKWWGTNTDYFKDIYVNTMSYMIGNLLFTWSQKK
tara:strand:- start:613 stop:1011 length:399 start_codon:yes stop_codon:yes gene_type:complete